MTTYNVRSGNLREQVEAEGVDEACQKAIEQADGKAGHVRLATAMEIADRPRARRVFWRLTENVLRDMRRLVTN